MGGKGAKGGKGAAAGRAAAGPLPLPHYGTEAGLPYCLAVAGSRALVGVCRDRLRLEGLEALLGCGGDWAADGARRLLASALRGVARAVDDAGGGELPLLDPRTDFKLADVRAVTALLQRAALQARRGEEGRGGAGGTRLLRAKGPVGGCRSGTGAPALLAPGPAQARCAALRPHRDPGVAEAFQVRGAPLPPWAVTSSAAPPDGAAVSSARPSAEQRRAPRPPLAARSSCGASGSCSCARRSCATSSATPVCSR